MFFVKYKKREKNTKNSCSSDSAAAPSQSCQNMLEKATDGVEHLVTVVIKLQVLARVAAATRSHCEARELAVSSRAEAAQRQRA